MNRRQPVCLLIATIVIAYVPSLVTAAGDDGLVAHYPFDGDTLDISGNDNHAASHGGVSFVLGVHGGAVSFDGSSGYLEADGDGPLALSQWTISVWVNPRANTDSQAMLVGKPNQSNRFNYNLSFASPSQVRSRYESNQTSDDRDFIVEGPQLTLDTWTHVVSTRDGSGNHCLYINGAQYDCELHTAAPAANTAPLWMGKWYSPPLNLFFTGELDDVRIYNRALSSAEIQAIFINEPSSAIHYVALGDSYSSGEGAGDYKIDLNDDGDTSDSFNGQSENTDQKNIDECHRSQWAWSSDSPGGDQAVAIDSLFSSPIERPHKFAACSGAIIQDLAFVRDRPDDPPEDRWYVRPQYESVSYQTDLVSLSIGGNDADFATILEFCLKLPNCSEYPPLGWGGLTIEQVATVKIGALGISLLQPQYEQIRNVLAPDAAVYVFGYPNLTPLVLYDPCATPQILNPLIPHPFDYFELAFLERLATRLNTAIECSALRAGVRFVDVRPFFSGHEYCGKNEDFINGLDNLIPAAYGSLKWKEAFHPNRAGQKAYARAFRARISHLGASALENPDPIPDSDPRLPDRCADFVNSSKSSMLNLPSLGALKIEHTTGQTCDYTNAFSPGQDMRVIGGGFAGSESLQVRLSVHSQAGYQRELQPISADSFGEFDVITQIPQDAPDAGMGAIEVGGLGRAGSGRLLFANLVMVESLTDDNDFDGIPDVCDNCPNESNTGQDDADGDLIGDACDLCPSDSDNDVDHDGTCADLDPCPFDQFNDVNGDGICGDVDGGFFADGFESGDTQIWSSAAGAS